MCAWHAETMAGLDVPNPSFRGRLRGSPGLEHIGVRIGPYFGVPSVDVSSQATFFEIRLQDEVDAMDARYPDNASLDGNGIIAAIRLAAWAHSEWIRIHPFANGNGRTAGCGPIFCSCDTDYRQRSSYDHAPAGYTRRLATTQ
jgi:hypothetical protein